MSDPAPIPAYEASLSALRVAALALDGVQIQPYAYGQEGLFLEGALIGHLHRSGVVAFPCPLTVRDSLIGSGRARPHYDDPELLWVVLTLDQPADLDLATRLLQAAQRIDQPRRQRSA